MQKPTLDVYINTSSIWPDTYKAQWGLNITYP